MLRHSFLEGRISVGIERPYPGEKPQLMQQTIKTLQDVAFAKLLQEEDVRARFIKQSTNEARALGGPMDFDNRTK